MQGTIVHGSPHYAVSLADLIGRVAGGDSRAFEFVYDEAANDVYATVRQVLVDPTQAEEVTQEVLLEVWRKATCFDPARGSARSWIRTIARRRAIDRVRASQTRRDAAVEQARERSVEERDSVFDEVFLRWRCADLHVKLRQLPAHHRDAVSLAFLGGLTHAEVARQLDVPLGTAKTRIRDGVIGLRRLMSASPNET